MNRRGIIGLRPTLPAWLATTAAVDRLGESRPGARAVRATVYRTRYFVNAHPTLYYPQARLRYGSRPEYLIDRDTELVIEGFGRAGSSFALLAFNDAQTRPVRTASHTHAAAQIVRGAQQGIPTLVIVRDPVQTTLSHVVRRRIAPRLPLTAWIRYHTAILPYRDRILVASFVDVTSDFGAVIDRLNDRFQTPFERWHHTTGNESRVFGEIDRRNRKRFAGGDVGGDSARAVARPTEEREARKRRYQAQLAGDDLKGLVAAANNLYEQLVS